MYSTEGNTCTVCPVILADVISAKQIESWKYSLSNADLGRDLLEIKSSQTVAVIALQMMHLLEKSKSSQHAHEAGHQVCWNEARVLQIEPNIIFRKYESAHTSLPITPINQPSLDVSPICTPVISMEDAYYKARSVAEFTLDAKVTWRNQLSQRINKVCSVFWLCRRTLSNCALDYSIYNTASAFVYGKCVLTESWSDHGRAERGYLQRVTCVPGPENGPYGWTKLYR
jgi:hypothetical protein